MLMTPKEYIESLRKLKTRVYMFGEKIDNWVDNPIIRPSINSVAMTYALALDPKYEDTMTATSMFTGDKINRFTHIHQSAEDLVKKVKMQRLLGQKTAACFQRCVGMDAFNAVYSTTYEIDAKYKTHYHENFRKFLIMVQQHDLTVDGAMTDPKGDRSKAPHEQKDPDMFVHVVERRPDGIVVCGAKAHQTGSINSHWHIFMPTIAMKKEDADWALSFACPTDAEGLYMIYGRQSCDTRKLEDCPIDLGNAKFGGQEALVVLDHVFIPNEYIFMNGEYEFAGMLVERFAGYHRQSYGGCKVGVGDVLIGAAALAAEYNGVEKASHIKDKLIEMTHLNETLYSCGIACSCEGCPTKAGNYQIDLLLANVCKQNVTRFPYEIVRLAEDIAGGLMVTMPSEKDFHSDLPVAKDGSTIGEICNKYFAARDDIPTEDRERILRFLENMCLGAAAVGYRTESLHGAGSPQAQRIMIARQGNIEAKKEMAKEIAGITHISDTEKKS
ncbi:4-hydroxyphenylacetate 3-hydroxylase family protein [Clostridium vitabionis]|uniref:4-hydroxyphenylacetate 3-hydroxylase family protein n=1 Tax=Clostridium vitabionis TaxID=2784388 RepID=UPI00188B937A|nr:4-hydroxyphenylacetate 3-hydroxylase family protein [Clostridium vitabionis]